MKKNKKMFCCFGETKNIPQSFLRHLEPQMVSYALYQSVNEHIIEKKYRIYRIYSKIIYNQT